MQGVYSSQFTESAHWAESQFLSVPLDAVSCLKIFFGFPVSLGMVASELILEYF